jgi:triosephosphate isomerase (TIM)
VRKLIVGNWKMNGLTASISEGLSLADGLATTPTPATVVICPPTTLLAPLAKALSGTHVQLGGQDCHAKMSGAHTGDISATMLKDAGASYVIIGHSERRTDHGETSEIVQAKARAAIGAGLVPITCVGETQEVRDAGFAVTVVLDQVLGSVPPDCDASQICIAYEPVWAIGTGRVPSVDDVAQMHAAIRETLIVTFGEARGASIPILYGGSVNPTNARDLLAVANVDGALVGGASLKADSFYAIISAAQ